MRSHNFTADGMRRLDKMIEYVLQINKLNHTVCIISNKTVRRNQLMANAVATSQIVVCRRSCHHTMLKIRYKMHNARIATPYCSLLLLRTLLVSSSAMKSKKKLKQKFINRGMKFNDRCRAICTAAFASNIHSTIYRSL